MKKRILSILLTLAMVLTLLPAAASAEELPDWYFLFAIFKNVDADYHKDGATKHAKYSMTQDEIDFARSDARDFEAFMSQVGVMRAHVDVMEIDTTVTELKDYGTTGGYLSTEQAEPLLKGKVDLDQYDHVTCVVSLNDSMGYLGLGGTSYENGTGHTCINLKNQEYCMKTLRSTESKFVPSMYVHEFLHFMERMTKKYGTEFGLHDIRLNFYKPDDDNGKECYSDIILNRARGTDGTGVSPAVWPYSPRVLRSIREFTIPSGVPSIGEWAFQGRDTMTRLTVPSSVTSIGKVAFRDCTSLSEVAIAPGLTSIGTWAFGNCDALTKITLPATVTSIEYAAFWKTGLKDVYYGGTEAQWKAIQFGEYNEALTKAAIHYQSSGETETKPSNFQDVPANAYYAQPVSWAVEQGVTGGTSATTFSPGNTCTQAQILTFLWRANGSPAPAQAANGSEYYASAVQWAKERKITGENLTPGNPCTRADVVTYLWRLAGNPSANASSFTDVAANASYANAVAWAVDKGVTGGTTATTFSPDSPCTRGQIVTFLYRALA